MPAPGVSIMEPEVLVLDEPSSNLDAASISDLRKTLAFWKGQGKTIVVSEHRLYYLRGLADRFIYMKGGKITREYTSEEFKGLSGASPDGKWATHFRPGTITTAANTAMHRDGTGAEAVPLCVSPWDRQSCTYRIALFRPGRIVGIIGNNGAGKSTFSRCFCGLEKQCGRGNLERQAIPSERSAEHLLYGPARG